MHLFMALSGAQHVQEIVKQCLNAQSFNMPQTNLITGKKEIVRVQGVWRPIEFGHYVFPKDSLNEVMQMLNLPEKMRTFESVPHLNKYTAAMRALLKLKKIPDMKDLPATDPSVMANRVILWHDHLNMIPIGIKEDVTTVRKFDDSGLILEKEQL